MFEPPYRVNDPTRLLSPSLLIFRDLVRKNLEAMIAMAKGPERLRPHVKTHKMAALVRMAEAMGVHKHKAATIAEAEMVAAAGGTDVLVAYPMVGPNIERLARLLQGYPNTTFRAVVDDPDVAKALSAELHGLGRALPVLVDLEVGMGRTGIAPDEEALALYELIEQLPNLELDGLHAYDGHIHDSDPSDRRESTRPGLEKTLALREKILTRGLPVPRLILGGTPTFPIHAEVDVPGVECSPGTILLQDAGYAASYPDLPFVPAALMLTRVVSRPRPGHVCLDLGHKAVAADPAGDRLVLLDVPDAKLGKQNEEHLVVATSRAGDAPPGTPLLAIPVHICPTCALHRFAYVIEDGELVDRWEVTARDRVLGV
jgi:D-threonine aldolase